MNKMCGSCGAALSEEQKFCSSCGSPVPEAPKEKVCLQCGAPLKEGQRFCASCGTAVEAEIQPSPPSVTSVCAKCGAPLKNGQKFCMACGNVVAPVDSDPAPSKTLTPPSKKKPTKKQSKAANITFWVGFGMAALGAVIFALIVLISLIGWGKIYLFNGYGITKVFASLSVKFLMPIGGIALLASLVVDGFAKWIPKLRKVGFKALCIILVAACLVFTIWGLTNQANTRSRYSSGSSGSSYSGSYSGSSSSSSYSYESATTVLKFSDIEIEHNTSYTVCTGTVKNTGKKTYEFVKIKGSFKNSSGTVLDTDWTYAVGAEGLAPGESKTFRMSVPKDSSIRSCSISIMN